MKVVALVSGGKDSCYSMLLAVREGHEIVALANLLPEESQPDELDSYMYQTVGHQLVEAYAACMGVPLFRRRLGGTSVKQDLIYTQTDGDEVEDLYALLAYVKDSIPGVTAVATGAIASDYQRLRVENVCARLNLVSLSYLWHQPQRQLLRGMIENNLHAILVKVAALGLDPHKHLGKTIAQMEPHLHKLNELYGSNVCGEGGEYESLTLDCPLFTRGRIVLDSYEIVMHSDDCVAPVGYLQPTAFHVELKGQQQHSQQQQKPRAEEAGPEGAQAKETPGAGHSTGTAGAATAPDAAAGGDAAGAAAATPYAHPGQQALSACCWGAALSSGPAPEARVVMVPSDWRPLRTCSSSAGKWASGSEYTAGEYEVAVRAMHSRDFVQVTCRTRRRAAAAALIPGDEINETDVANALHDMLEALQGHLDTWGLQLHHALYVHLYLANMGHFAAANSVYCKYFPAFNAPSRACVQLPLPPGCPVLATVLLARNAYTPPPPLPPPSDAEPGAEDAGACAANGKEAGACDGGRGSSHRQAQAQAQACAPGGEYRRRVLHVQSISSWAPSCIGPYSQANTYAGLLYMAGAIPLHPATMVLVPGGPAAQAARALASCEAVAIALRSSVVKACLGMVVYWASSIGQAGREEIQSVIQQAMDTGVIPHHLYATAPAAATNGAGADSGRRISASVGAGGDADGGHDEDGDGDEDEEEEEAGEPDMYLAPPSVRHPVRSNAVYVEVPALPRGSLVEIQPLLLDLQWLEQQRAAEAAARPDTPDGEDSGNSSDDRSARHQHHHHRHHQHHVQACYCPGDQAAAAATANGREHHTTHAVPGAHTPGQHAQHQASQGQEGQGAGNGGDHANGNGNGVSAAAADASAGSAAAPPQPHPNAHPAAAAAAAGASCSGGAGRAPAAHAGDDDVMVTTMCHHRRLLKSLLHLPAAVFQRPSVNCRLHAAASSVLRTYHMHADCLVGLRGWYDVNKVSPAAAEELMQAQTAADGAPAMHISWAPVQSVGTSISRDVAAVVEVLVCVSE